MKNSYIDIVCNLYTHRTVQEGRIGIDDEFKRQVRMPENLRNGLSIEDYLEKMDRSNIERSLLIAVCRRSAGRSCWTRLRSIFPNSSLSVFTSAYPGPIPWTDEMISMCWKHDNVYTAGDAYAPRYWPTQYLHYANTYGRHKVMFGSDWPVIDPERAVEEVARLDLKAESRRMLMRDNALRVFRLPGHENLPVGPV